MSKQRILPLELSDTAAKTGGRKWAIYGVLAVVVLLVIAYIDGGEEPIRPIEQQIALPQAGGNSINSGEE
ncbi:hypothetical protein [Erythrobacter sp. Alg231-14]|uniref:hypothetical protein n=1 Tax=Erythrobacter sp. Alg231-14 TaxID=1922225 RepID=UPI000D562E4E